MIILDKVTMICADCYNHGLAITALKKSLSQVTPARTILFTDKLFNIPGIETIIIEPIRSKREYSRFIIKELHKYIETEFILIVQGDGYVLDANQWSEEFLKYDAIGAPWPYDHDRRVGNGGAAIRSQKLQKILGTDELIDVVHPEDQSVSIIYKFYLEEKYDIKFAPEELASKFSFELIEPTSPTFAFHSFHWPPYRKTVVISRHASLGDVIMCEPVLHHFYLKEYRVVLDTLPQFYELFRNHYFPVEYYEHFNKKVKHEVINLNMSYESDPQKLHLKAYYEFAGVPEDEQVIRNPKLNYQVEANSKLFNKYAVIHIDKRPDGHRDCNGINWKEIVELLNQKGYTAIQIGKGEHENTGAIEMKTVTQDLLCYLIAGCDLFIGIDSGPSNIALATGRKMITFHGSVNPDYIYPETNNVYPRSNHYGKVKPCNTPFCWHNAIGCEGMKCVVNEKNPPCAIYSTESLIYKILHLE
jgi:ADP-heptose:LPS heptosyltransferase